MSEPTEMAVAFQHTERRRAMAEAAQRERQIRADLIEEVKSAIERESDRMGNEIGCSDDVHQVFAEAAVDALADYYRRAAGLTT